MEPSAPPLQTALSKARWRILPLLGAGYLIAYMDRGNLSFAAEQMNRSLHFSPAIYGLGAGLFFISYALCEVPSNSLLLRFGARRWLARIMLTWGVIAVGMMFVHSTRSFYTMRLLLGAAEAGYFPGALFYLSQWFPSKDRAQAISLFYVAFPLSNTLMGLLAGTLLSMNGRLGLAGWQWLFLLEGVPAILASVAFWFLLPDTPADASWLSAEERAALADAAGTMPEARHGSWRMLREVAREPQLWLLSGFNFCMLGSAYSISFFLPQLLRGLTHWTAASVGYLIAAVGVVQATSMLANAAWSDRRGERRWHVGGPVLAMIALLSIAAGHLVGALPVVCLVLYLVLYTALQCPMLALATDMRKGRNGAIAIAAFNMFGIVGGFAGPYATGWLLQHTGGYAAGLRGVTVVWSVAIVCLLFGTARAANAQAPAMQAGGLALES